MKVENLKVGQIIPSYKALCGILEVEIKDGNSKKSQIKELNRFISYVKKGNKFIINEIYDIPFPPNNNITQYIPMIERLILHYMVCEDNFEEGRLYIPKSKLFKMLKMINKQYSEYKYHKMQLSYKMNIPKEIIVDFYETSDSLLERNIERALNSLVSQSLIQWNHVFTVVEQESISLDNIREINETLTDKYGDTKEVAYGSTFYLKKKHREATEEETKLILRIQRDLLEEMKIDTIQEVLKYGKGDEFYSNVRQRLKESSNLINSYKSYEMIFNMDHIQKKYENVNKFILDHETETKLFIELNEQIGIAVNSNSINRYNNAIKGIGKEKMLETRKSNSYVNDINKLVSKLVILTENELKEYKNK